MPDSTKRIDTKLDEILKQFRQHTSGGVMSDTPHKLTFDGAKQALTQLMSEVVDEVIGADKEVLPMFSGTSTDEYFERIYGNIRAKEMRTRANQLLKGEK